MTNTIMVAAPEIMEDAAIPLEKGFDLERHINTMQHMFNSERKRVRLICDNSVMDAIVDRWLRRQSESGLAG